ncbi:MAG: Bax inhibitor-1/YccA family protein [Porticoccaceae bacterium]|nr:Bax inhibitor-1/YccA family protein [Porticoccaceae bacterium]
MSDYNLASQTATASVEVSESALKVLRNTYFLLGMTLTFSAICAVAGMVLRMPYLGLWMLLPYIGILFAVEKNKTNSWGIVWVFALTGWLGLTLAPILSAYMSAIGFEPIALALGGTATIFFASSAYVLTTKKNLNFMSGFLMTGILVAFIAGIANVFLQIQGLALAVSCMFLVLSSGLMMWQTSAIIHGGETNYISATVTLFVSIYNVFLSLLSLIGMSND